MATGGRWLRAAIALAAGLVAVWAIRPAPGLAQDVAVIRTAYLEQVVALPPKLSNLDVPPENEGIDGGQLSIKDNNTTGKFLKQSFEMVVDRVSPDADPVPEFEKLVADGIHLFVLNVPADALLRIADTAKGQDVLIFNVGAPDDRLRNEDCRKNVMHIGPSRAMLTDGLAQYMAWKRWTNWFLVVGKRKGDALFAAALKRAAKRFGAKIVAERPWTYGPDTRRTAQSQVPALTQGADYDILMVADEIGVFGEYLAYRTWEPRPVAGTQGLVPTSWHRTHEQWGAAQLQSRFWKAFKRHMTALDYQVWAAIRTIGEGATRTNSADFKAIRDYIQGPNFELAGFKGQKLTFRQWDWQLRQPILLTVERALVSVSPQQGFLHQRSLLDTLGVDQPESDCRLH